MMTCLIEKLSTSGSAAAAAESGEGNRIFLSNVSSFADEKTLKKTLLATIVTNYVATSLADTEHFYCTVFQS